MSTKRLIVCVGLIGAFLGMAADGYTSYQLNWGFDLLRNLIMTALAGGLFYGAAHISLCKSKNSRVEEVTSKQRSPDDYYESITIQQKEF